MHFFTDKNRDLPLTMAELTEVYKGKVSEEESKALKSIDADGDGSVTKEELSNFFDQELAQRQKDSNEDETIHTDDGNQSPQYTEDDIDRFLEIHDRDKDGILSYDEFKNEHDEL